MTTAPSPFALADGDLQFAGATDRFHKNIAAITLLHDLEQTGRPATDAERLTLAHYSAFGESAILNRLFRWDQQRWRYVVDTAYAPVLSDEDAKHLRRAALTAFYTPLDLIRVLWRAVDQLGLSQLDAPRIIEPAVGVGHFISAMPPDLRRRAAITAVELDPVTARITRQIHPDITLHGVVGFEAVDLPTDWFDLAISNVPFGETSIFDPQLPEEYLRRTIHDYFLAKALRIVRPGGLIVFLTSWGTLDKRSTAVRHWVAERATLLGAFRLPNGVFAATSGSASATDLLILQKRPCSTPDSSSWLDLADADYRRSTAHTSLTSGSRYTREYPDSESLAAATLAVNQYWLTHPAHIIGTPQIVVHDTSLWLQVMPPDSCTADTLDTCLAQALPHDVVTTAPVAACAEDRPFPSTPVSHTRSAILDLASISPTHQARATALAAVYHAAKALIRAELDEADDAAVTQQRAILNTTYGAFVAQYGVIADPRNQRLFKDAPELAFVLALEANPRTRADGRWQADKERIFTMRTLRRVRTLAPGSLTPIAALLHCLDERGRLDLDHVAALCGRTVPQIIDDLGERIFRIPGTDRYDLADAYLSGNVRAKLRDAELWATHDPSYTRNVDALAAVQPTPLGPSEITLNLNAYWLPGEVVTDFIASILPRFQGTAHYDDARGEWRLTDTYDVGRRAIEATTKWGTNRANALDILAALLKGSPIAIYDELDTGDGVKRVLNPSETVAAQEKQSAIIRAFRDWVWTDGARAEQLANQYNARFNSVRIRQYDGRHLTFPGMATHILRDGDLADYQKGAVWQILQNPTALLAFAVGGGKTFTAIASAVEAKRMGLIQKALVVVPNTLVGQWAQEARRLYPDLHILAMGPEDFERARRGTVLSRIAMRDWDLVIIAHTSFTFLPIGAELLDAFRDQETDRLRSYLETLRATASSREDRRSLKQIEKTIAQFEERLSRLAGAIARDSERAITWRELGIDMLIVDEAHAFKNLFTPTRLTNIAGLPRAHSQRALDMRIKTWDLIRRSGKVVFLTATPIMNTIGEAYVMQLYLQQAQLEAVGIHHFDAWVSLYAEPRMSFELKPDSSGFRMTTRLASFVNVPEMAALWRQCMNVRTKAQMQLPEPELVTGKIIPVVVPASPALTRFVQSLAARADAIRSGRVDPRVDNMLTVTSDGRKAALDIRLVIPGVPRPRHAKILALVDRVAALYRTFAPLKGTQLVFCDLATPKGKADAERAVQTTPRATSDTDLGSDAAPTDTPENAAERHTTNFVYHEIRAELVQRGIPAAEIAFIHEYATKEQRAALFAALNDGRVRILLGSTSMMSTGMNVQRRLIALHNLDCPWRPGDLEQRHGRILRQGNLWPEIYLFSYLTEGSFDGYSWQLIESKARFIAQALAGEVTTRTVEDTDELVLSAAEVKAIASGNPQIVRKVQLEAELARLERVRIVHEDTRIGLLRERARAERECADLASRRAVLETAQTIISPHADQPFTTQIRSGINQGFNPHSKRSDAGIALRAVIDQYAAAAGLMQDRVTADVGSYQGLTIHLAVHPRWGVEVTLRLPDGTRLDDLTVKTDAGAFASADAVIASLPRRIAANHADVARLAERIATIDTEYTRMACWEGQAAYAAARDELATITAAFTAAEADTPAATADVTANRDTPITADLLAEVAALLAEDAHRLHDEQPLAIPPASAALAFMEAELRRLSDALPVITVDDQPADEALVTAPAYALPAPPAPPVPNPSSPRTPAHPRVGVPRFGQPLPGVPAQHRPTHPIAAPSPDLLSLLAAAEALPPAAHAVHESPATTDDSATTNPPVLVQTTLW